MARENMGRNLPLDLVSRVSRGIRSYVSAWFSPERPMQPVAQQTQGRAFDYPIGYNLRTTPRQEEAIGFNTLRQVADTYDLLRLVIETRKDQIEEFDWEIAAVKKEEQDKYQKEIDAATAFFQRPDREHNWSTWLRIMLEDLFVVDAIAVYPRFTKGGQLYSLEILDSTTIKRVIDETGRTPIPPDPAYQQVLKGVVASNYTTEELAYFIRNPRSGRLYGYSPVEQVLMTVNIALRRQQDQLNYYTEGNIPEALCGVPENWTADQLKDFQIYWDSIMEGNTAIRRHLKFIPFDASKVQYTRTHDMKEQYDDWLARIICFAFSISPTVFVKETNRATAETLYETTRREGVRPLLNYVKVVIDHLIHSNTGFTFLEFRWKIGDEIDVHKRALVDDIYIKNGTLSIDRVRERLGEPPIGIGNLVWTGSGPVPVEKLTLEAFEEKEAERKEMEERRFEQQSQQFGSGAPKPGQEKKPKPGEAEPKKKVRSY